MTMKRLVVAAAAAAVLAVTGCAGGPPNTAAEIEGQTLTVAEAQRTASDFNAGMAELGMADPTQEIAAADVVAIRVQAAANDAIARDLGVQIPPQQMDMVVQQSFMGAEQALADPRVGPLLQDSIRAQLVHSQIPEADYAAAAGALDVTINPRFGAWSEQGMSAGGTLATYSQEAIVEAARQQR